MFRNILSMRGALRMILGIMFILAGFMSLGKEPKGALFMIACGIVLMIWVFKLNGWGKKSYVDFDLGSMEEKFKNLNELGKNQFLKINNNKWVKSQGILVDANEKISGRFNARIKVGNSAIKPQKEDLSEKLFGSWWTYDIEMRPSEKEKLLLSPKGSLVLFEAQIKNTSGAQVDASFSNITLYNGSVISIQEAN